MRLEVNQRREVGEPMLVAISFATSGSVREIGSWHSCSCRRVPCCLPPCLDPLTPGDNISFRVILQTLDSAYPCICHTRIASRSAVELKTGGLQATHWLMDVSTPCMVSLSRGMSGSCLGIALSGLWNSTQPSFNAGWMAATSRI